MKECYVCQNGKDNKVLCEKCKKDKEENFSTCASCEDFMLNEDMLKIDIPGLRYMCYQCLEWLALNNKQEMKRLIEKQRKYHQYD